MTDEELVEAVSLGILRKMDDWLAADKTADDADLARAALSAIREAGMVVVPQEPTREMLRAASKSMSPGRRPTPEYVSCSQKHAIRYRAMIAAHEGEKE